MQVKSANRGSMNPNSTQREVISTLEDVFSELDALDESADMIDAFLEENNNNIKVKKNG